VFWFEVLTHLLISILQILALNGTPVRNLKQLANMVENCDEKFLRFDLEHQQVEIHIASFMVVISHERCRCAYNFFIIFEQLVVLEAKKAKEATAEILETHCIPSAMSDDLKS
jgi:hypothetical protein